MFIWQTTGVRLGAILCFVVLSLAQANALSLTETKHLLDRTSFGMSIKDAAAFAGLSREQAVDRLLGELTEPSVSPPPPYVTKARPDYWAAGWEERDTVLYRVSEINQLQAWWIENMIETDQPFAEKLALFWHNHFVSRFDPGRISAPFHDQIVLFRGSESHNFRSLTRAILRDPMMLTSLDNIHNVKSRPNENLARELLELFTLGIGHYKETDIKQAAKVLAGHGVDRANGWRYTIDRTETDRDAKAILGAQIPAGSDDDIDALIDIILAKPEVSRFIAAKFYAEFVSLDVDEGNVDRLARILRQNDFDTIPFLRALLLSDAFWAEENRAGLVKSPIELIVGFMRSLELCVPDHGIILDYLAQLGQSPFMAPSVAGWRGGKEWLTIKLLDERSRIVTRLWSAYDDARRQRPMHANDLFVRFSSEQLTKAAPLVVAVNGQTIATVTAALGTNTTHEKASSEPGGLKPMWETFSVARDRLPDIVNTITVRLDAQNPDTRLFVNWVAVDGHRLSPADARWELGDGTSCSAEIPRGMFYCDVALSFTVDDKNRQTAVMDDLHAPHNSIIEYGTGRLAAAAAGQINAPQAPDFDREIDGFISAHPEAGQSFTLRQFLLPTAPVYGRPIGLEGSGGHVGEARVLTTDPAYNLK